MGNYQHFNNLLCTRVLTIEFCFKKILVDAHFVAIFMVFATLLLFYVVFYAKQLSLYVKGANFLPRKETG
jgi:hypothetical protein